LRDEVGNQEDDDECSGESVKVFVTAKSSWCGARFSCVKLRGHPYQYAVRGADAPVFDRA